MNRYASLLLIFSLAFGPVFAASSDILLDTFPVSRVNNNAALQNGAKLYFNYCLGCHGISQVRYSRLKDLGLTESQIKENYTSVFLSQITNYPYTIMLLTKELLSLKMVHRK